MGKRAKKSNKNKILHFALFILVTCPLVCLWIYFFYIKPDVFKVDNIPFSLYKNSLNTDREAFLKQIRVLIDKLEKSDKKEIFLVNTTIPKSLLIETLKEFYKLYEKYLDEEDFNREFREKFNVYRINNIRHRVLLTGYFMPELEASFTKREGFEYPIYSRPRNLVNMKVIKNVNEPQVVWGIKVKDEVIPYYTRYEIDWEKKEIDAPVLAWIKSPVDGLMLHIQGSGILKFGDLRRNISYDANNGHKYGSVCRYFINKKMLTKENCTWENIKKIWNEKPSEFIEACKENPRYIFFNWQDKEGAFGSSGIRLIGEKSLAADPDFYPIGIPFIIKSKKYKGLAINLDRGAAIKGVGRFDIYFGEGENALNRAQDMRDRGEIYFFLIKNPLLEGVKGWR